MFPIDSTDAIGKVSACSEAEFNLFPGIFIGGVACKCQQVDSRWSHMLLELLNLQ